MRVLTRQSLGGRFPDQASVTEQAAALGPRAKVCVLRLWQTSVIFSAS